MSNRVEELERKAKELQAAVNGLTEELVETKERVRQLEDAVDVDDPAVRSKTAVEPEPEPDAESESTETTETVDDPETEAEADDGKREQRFVDADAHEKTLDNALGPEGTSTDEEAKSEEKKGEETESEQDESDIIVA